MRSVKHGGKKGMRFRYKLSAVKRQNKKQKKKMRNTAGCSVIKKAWKDQLSTRQNLKAMGLVYDPNEALNKKSENVTDMDITEIELNQKEIEEMQDANFMGVIKKKKMGNKSAKATFIKKRDQSEVESSKMALELQQIALDEAREVAEQKQKRRQRAKLQQSDIEFCQKMIQRHGEDYEGMSRDPLNIWQNTPRQIERKIGVYKRSISSC